MPKLALAISMLLGGLALFMYGLGLMTAGLRRAAGEGLRRVLARTARSRAGGGAAGALAGALVQSTAVTVMLVGLVHAGVLSLPESVPLILGANVGTALSLQLMSFHVGDACYAAVALGLLLHLLGGAGRAGAAGQAVLGFGLMFLGLQAMSAAVQPYREALIPWLAHVDGTHPAGLLAGLAGAALLTAAIQSSGATIGLVFALAGAGVITGLPQAFPIILGAHVGGCTPALLASLGAHPEARRTALAHLAFNLSAAAFGVAAAPLVYRWVPLLSADPVHQAANANLAHMLSSALLALPASGALVALVRRAAPSRTPPPERSRLDPGLLATPEDALAATIGELRRAAGVCLESFRLDAGIILRRERGAIRTVEHNERAIDETKRAVKDYLVRIAERYLSRRQALLLPLLDQIAIGLERIHDHVKVVSTLSQQRYTIPAARFREDDLEALFDLRRRVEGVLEKLQAALAAAPGGDFYAGAHAVLEAREEYLASSAGVMDRFLDRVARHEYLPASSLYFSEYVHAFDRIVRHARLAALCACRPDFWIKAGKLGQAAPPPPDFIAPELVDVDDFLERQRTRAAGGADAAGGSEHA